MSRGRSQTRRLWELHWIFPFYVKVKAAIIFFCKKTAKDGNLCKNHRDDCYVTTSFDCITHMGAWRTGVGLCLNVQQALIQLSQRHTHTLSGDYSRSRRFTEPEQWQVTLAPKGGNKNHLIILFFCCSILFWEKKPLFMFFCCFVLSAVALWESICGRSTAFFLQVEVNHFQC